MTRHQSFASILAGLAIVLAGTAAEAKGGSNLSLTTTGAISGTVVSGVITITNTGSKSESVAAMRTSLEVRSATGAAMPLPPGSSSGYYVVATVSLPPPGAIGPLATVNVPYSVDTCTTSSPYSGAKDMRSSATADVAAAAGTQSISGRSSNYALPGKCPVCGNGVLEAGEQCDVGSAAGTCCYGCRFVADDTVCNDGNACTQTDRCYAGACVGSAPRTCSAADQCHTAGTCNPATGLCSNPSAANGSPCNDGNLCTQSDTCLGGVCSGSQPVACAADDDCHTATCNPSSGSCSQAAKPDGTECADGDACTAGDACLGGTCVAGPARNCDDHMSCTDDNCAAATGCAHATATCDVCDSEQCNLCSADCTPAEEQCSGGCWSGFFACLNGCTSTYCAPFCQVDLGRCLSACPTADACRQSCEAGNACSTGCAPF